MPVKGMVQHCFSQRVANRHGTGSTGPPPGFPKARCHLRKIPLALCGKLLPLLLDLFHLFFWIY